MIGTCDWCPNSQIINRADVEEAATADTCQIKLRNGFRRQAENEPSGSCIAQACNPGKVEVREQQPSQPTPSCRSARTGPCVDAPRKVRSRADRRRLPSQLIDAIGADLITIRRSGPGGFALEQDALPGRDAAG